MRAHQTLALLLVSAGALIGCGGIGIYDEGYPRTWSPLLEASNCEALVGTYDNFAVGARRSYPAFLTALLFSERVEATHVSIERSEEGVYHLRALNGMEVVASEPVKREAVVEGGYCENGYLEYELPIDHAFAGEYRATMRLSAAQDGALMVRTSHHAAGFGYYVFPALGTRITLVRSSRSSDLTCDLTCQVCKYPVMERHYRGSCFETPEARAIRAKRTRSRPY